MFYLKPNRRNLAKYTHLRRPGATHSVAWKHHKRGIQPGFSRNPKYLGVNLVQVSGRTFLEPGSETHMFAFYRSGVILVPGQSLPLTPYGPFESNLLQKVNREKLPLIFLPGCFDNVGSLEDLVEFVGTTADLVAIHIPNEDEEGGMHAIFVGRQRIRINKVTRDESYPLLCFGTILPELSVDREMATNPLGWGLVPRSWSRFGMDPCPIRRKASETDLLPVPETSHVRRRSRRRSRHSRDSTSSSSSSTYYSATGFVPPGNPLSMFDSRLSTWRHFGPVNTVSITSPCSSPNSRLAESGEELDVDPVHNSAPELSSKCPLPAGAAESTLEAQQDVVGQEETANIIGPKKRSYPSGARPEPDDVVTEDVELIMDWAVDRVGRPFRYRIRQPCHPRLPCRRDVLAATGECFATLPIWVYRQYDVSYLVAAIQTELVNWNDTWVVDHFRPDLAVPFSYWLVQNLPMPGPLKAHILSINHVVPRLRALLDVIRRSAACVCVLCDCNITSSRHIICLAQEGSFQTYVNPAGVLHDIVTVSQVTHNSVSLVGSPSEEYSWFPGYSWTIANCTSCSHHLGWLFNAVKDELRPRRFWGIRRDAIVPGLINSTAWRPCI
ncbi:cereblon [Clonorchis sinensis]|uniref:Cereblon n=1 Tax=Clonorchis sinensis TaxID=79923 RepID=H2KRU8_CLOSI|nr:cereblon [Clonorchis sinensis]